MRKTTSEAYHILRKRYTYVSMLSAVLLEVLTQYTRHLHKLQEASGQSGFQPPFTIASARSS
eukprot:1909388-Amphidinium_carterae.1